MKTFKFCITILTFWILALLCGNISAQTTDSVKTTKSEWVEKATIEIPYNVEINKGITKKGNPKYTIDIEDITVYVNPSNYEKFIKKEIVLLLVEWYNPTTGKYKYTTRQKAKSQIVKKLNLDELW